MDFHKIHKTSLSIPLFVNPDFVRIISYPTGRYMSWSLGVRVPCRGLSGGLVGSGAERRGHGLWQDAESGLLGVESSFTSINLDPSEGDETAPCGACMDANPDPRPSLQQDTELWPSLCGSFFGSFNPSSFLWDGGG